MRTSVVPIATDAVGAGTASTIAPLSGEVCQIRTSGVAFGTATLSVSRAVDGYSLWNSKVAGTVFPYPRPPVDGYLIVKVSNGGNRRNDTVEIFWEDV